MAHNQTSCILTHIYFLETLTKNGIVLFSSGYYGEISFTVSVVHNPKRKKNTYPFPYKIFIILYFKRKNQINSVLKGTLKM